MSRRENALKFISKKGPGLEIGPSINPLAPKKDGYNVHIIDHASREQLLDKYKNHNVKLENIEEVDFVWRGESYAELTGKENYYEWIIASHLIEHVPDLIGFLKDCEGVLKEDGVISLVVPDKRYCFDHFRPVTGISKVIDSHFGKNKSHTPGTVVEQILNGVSKGGKIAWGRENFGKYNLGNKLSVAQEALQSRDAGYSDRHAWVFVPHSFRLIIHDLFCLGLIPFQEVDFSPTEGCEFYMTLGRRGKGIDKSRLEMLQIIESECCARDFTLAKKMMSRLAKPINKTRRYIKKHYA
jgi:predicted SAM-dependent methyltransferase